MSELRCAFCDAPVDPKTALPLNSGRDGECICPRKDAQACEERCHAKYTAKLLKKEKTA